MSEALAAYCLPDAITFNGTVRAITEKHAYLPDANGDYPVLSNITVVIDSDQPTPPEVDLIGLTGSLYSLGDRLVISVTKEQP